MVALTLARADVRVGDPFPVLSSADLVGSPPPSIAGKVVLVDFWASWCAPCRASFPAYAKLNERMAEKGLVIVAVSFVSKWAPPFYTALDAHHQLVSRVGVPSMPTSFLLDRSGRVRWMSVGYHGSSTDKALQSEIETLLNEKTP
jgi:thiol-disulfide isomerase/thioredoxin